MPSSDFIHLMSHPSNQFQNFQINCQLQWKKEEGKRKEEIEVESKGDREKERERDGE